jgi:hypothetical protein
MVISLKSATCSFIGVHLGIDVSRTDENNSMYYSRIPPTHGQDSFLHNF